jgi:hypothetical protein
MAVERIRTLVQTYTDGPRALEDAVRGLSEEELRCSPAKRRAQHEAARR